MRIITCLQIKKRAHDTNNKVFKEKNKLEKVSYKKGEPTLFLLMQILRIHICRPLAGVSAKMTLDSCCLGQPCFLQPKGILSISRKTIWTEPWSSIKEIRRSVLVFRSLEGRAIIPKVYQSPEAQLPSPTAPRNYLTNAKASQNLGATEPGFRVPRVTLGRVVHLTPHCRGGTVAPRPAGLGLL